MKIQHRINKRYYFLIGIILILFIGIVYFIQFTPEGYRMTVPYRSFEFDKVQDNIYIDKTFSGDKDEVKNIIGAARSRVSDFWGNLESSPVIIISDNAKTLKKLGGTHDTILFVFLGAHCYTSISNEYLNIDIVAHEMTHAELYKRLYKGKIYSNSIIPTWFDEGVATQNDYREQYSEETWKQKTNSGTNVISLDEMNTAEEFFAGDTEDRRFRYLISRHEVKAWIDQNGINGLLSLIDKLNKGGDFSELYNANAVN